MPINKQEELSEEVEKRFDDWFSQFTKPYEEYEKNRDKLWKMLGVVGEKEAPMEIIARLEEIKRLRKMQHLFKKKFLEKELSKSILEAKQSGIEEERKRIAEMVANFEEQPNSGALDAWSEGRVSGRNQTVSEILEALKE